MSGDPALYEKVVKAVNEMKFKPMRIAGQAIKTEVMIKYVQDAGVK